MSFGKAVAMNAAVAIVLAIVLVAFNEVDCYSSGAPSQACDNLTPNAGSHGAQPQSTSVPYSVDLAPLTGTSGVVYTPGRTYTRMSLSRLNRIHRLFWRERTPRYVKPIRAYTADCVEAFASRQVTPSLVGKNVHSI